MASDEAEPLAEWSPAEAEAASYSTVDADVALPSPSDESKPSSSYQNLFRAIGAALDEDTTTTIGIVEVEDGFLVRAERFRQLLVEVSVSHLSRSTLEQRSEEMRRTHRVLGRRNHPGIWDGLPMTHQDFFRALGYELDSVGARHVVIDEQSDGLLLWYQQEGHDGRPRIMRRLALGRPEIEEILNDAVRRRRVPADGKPSHYYLMNRIAGDRHPSENAAGWILQRSSVPYQDILRGLGRVLDGKGARHVCVLEMPDGFAVRYQLPSGERLSWARFSDEDVLVQGPESRQKPPPSSLFRRPAPLPLPPEPDGYSDLFRALGRELQRTGASDIFITEEDGGLAVSYQHRDLRRPTTARRTMRLLTEADQKQMTAEARARRQVNAGPKSPRR